MAGMPAKPRSPVGLDQLTRQFDKLDRDQTILIETVGLFVRHYLSVSLPIPEAHQEAARAQGRARFEQFIQQLARHLQRGRQPGWGWQDSWPARPCLASIPPWSFRSCR